MDRNYVLIVDEAKSQSSSPSFDAYKIEQDKTEKETRQEAHCQKRATMYYCPPPSLRGDRTLSCLPGAPASMLQEKNKHKQTKTRTTGSAQQEKQTTMFPSPSPRCDKLPRVCLAHPLRCCKKKKQENKKNTQKAHCMKNKTTMYPPPSLRLDKLSYVCLAHPLSGMRCDHRQLCSR